MEILLLVRITHIMAAGFLIGATIFSYFFLRRALLRIPPAHAVVVSQRVGTLFTIFGLTSLGLLVITGLVRLYLVGAFGDLFTAQFYLARYGRWLAVMMFAALVTFGSSIFMTLGLRPQLMKKLSITSNPTVKEVDTRRATQLSTSTLLDTLQLVNVISTAVAATAGASLMIGGLF